MVLDIRGRYQIDRHWSLAAGIDNLTNDRYFLYYPFAQRMVYAELKYDC